MTNRNPWASLNGETEPGKLLAQRIAAKHAHDVFWARDENGNPILLFDFNATPALKKVSAVSRGIEVHWNKGKQLRLVLLDPSSRDIFFVICDDIVSLTAAIEDATSSADAVVARLAKWKRFLSKFTAGLLSEKQIMGLMGELQFLKTQLISQVGPSALSFWQGPNGATHDFAFGRTNIEVKVRAVSTPATVQISSADQLWASGSNSQLILAVFSVSRTSSGSSGITLRGLVDLVRTQLRDSAYEQDFSLKLLESGYVDLPEYEVDLFSIRGPECFRVEEGFPRLGPTTIPAGVSSINYRVHLDFCQKFKFELEWSALQEGGWT